MAEKIDAILALRGDGKLSVGRERIQLLEAVAEHGSITKAAQVLGYSYKYAWDSVTTINNLLPRPALMAQSGGRRGGGTVLTEEGRRLIAAFRRLEDKLARISAVIAEDGLDEHTDLLFWNVVMKTSARNVLYCEVVSVIRAAVNVEVILKLAGETTITAIVTNESADALGLEPGREVVVLVNSSFVLLARGEEPVGISARNRIKGVVAERIDGAVNSEITLDVGGGKTLTAVVTRDAADELGLTEGQPAWALFKASHVILAAD